MLSRLIRKGQEVLRFPALAADFPSRFELLLLGLAHSRIISYRTATRLGRSIITPTLQLARGNRVRLDLTDTNQVDCFIELFIERVYDLTAVRFSPDLIVDCGAYSGFFTTLAAGYFSHSRLVAFEANPANLPSLQANLSLLARVVEIHAAAAHIADGEVCFAGEGMGGMVASQGIKVTAVDLARWLKTAAPRKLVLKLDVEGAESALLPLLLPQLPQETALFLETHHPDPLCDKLLGCYRLAGFGVTEVRRRPAMGGGYYYTDWLLLRR